MNDIPLPPSHLRKGPKKQRVDDEVYVANALQLANSVGWMCAMLQSQSTLNISSLVVRDKHLHFGGLDTATLLHDRTILDLGCGSMRLLTGLNRLDVQYNEYLGIDVDKACIDWASSNCMFGKERFLCIDVKNERYNPEGSSIDRLRLPVESDYSDLIVLRSVFTHMRLKTIKAYLPELARIVTSTGFIYVSAYVADDAPLETENPVDFGGTQRKYNGPLHVVQLNRAHFEDCVQSVGLKVRALCWNIFGQPTYLLTK